MPSPEVETFRTHANWIRAFATMAGRGAALTAPKRALERLATAAAAFPVPGGQRGLTADVLPCLQRAWGAELLLNLGRRFATEDEPLRLVNSWGAVQAYYAAYGATQALLVAEGRSRPLSHPATQMHFLEMWVRRRGSLPPWSFAVGDESDPRVGDDGCINGPGRRLNPTVHSWSGCSSDTCWEIAAIALRSTRQDAIDERLRKKRVEKLAARKKAWHEEEKIRQLSGRKPRKEPTWPRHTTLTKVESARVHHQVRACTLLDYLYRLRIKANYEDARMFTDGPTTAEDTQRVALDLVSLTMTTMLVHEVRIAQLIGRGPVVNAADAWLDRHNPPGREIALAARIALLDSVA